MVLFFPSFGRVRRAATFLCTRRGSCDVQLANKLLLKYARNVRAAICSFSHVSYSTEQPYTAAHKYADEQKLISKSHNDRGELRGELMIEDECD